jgi:hypothetical protein
MIWLKTFACAVSSMWPMIWAIFRRWVYLTFKGAWRGHCGYNFYNAKGKLSMLASGVRSKDPWPRMDAKPGTFRVWWRAKGVY